MRIGVFLNPNGDIRHLVRDVADLEQAGVDIGFVAEAYSFDAVSQLGFVAARTERLEIASGVLSLYTRTPALTAMTAAGLDHVSDGRFSLGIGASGPLVVEGFHGVRYNAPLVRTREVVDVCRSVWRAEHLTYQGSRYRIPLPPDRDGSSAAKPLKMINKPVRDRIPILIAATGPKNVTLAAEIADGWMSIFFWPEKSNQVWGEALLTGAAKRDAILGPLDVVVSAPLAIDDAGDDSAAFAAARRQLALYVGGMGARGSNFYYDLACRYGYSAEAALVQRRYLSGDREGAQAAVPMDLVRATSLIGPASYVAERVEALRAAGVTTLNVMLMAERECQRLADISRLRDMVAR